MMQPSNDTNLSPQYPFAQMIRTPLAGQVIGQKDSQFFIAEWTDQGAPAGPRRYIAPFHVHYSDDEAWYVIEGTLAFRLGDQEITALAGSAVLAPRGVPHTYWNPYATPARYLLVMTPTIRHLIEELHQESSHDPLAIQSIYRQHNSALAPL